MAVPFLAWSAIGTVVWTAALTAAGYRVDLVPSDTTVLVLDLLTRPERLFGTEFHLEFDHRVVVVR